MNIPAKLGYDAPRWMLEDYPEMGDDIRSDIESAIYWSIREIAEEKAEQANEPINFDSDEELTKIRLLSDAVMRSAVQADRITEGASKAFYALIYDVQKRGLYYAQEYETVQEWLVSKIPRLSEKSGELYDILFLINHFFPMLERVKNGKVRDLMKLKQHWSKTKAAIPFLRNLVENVAELEQNYKEAQQKVDTEISKLEQIIEKDPEKKKELSKNIKKLNQEKKMLERSYPIEIKKANTEFKDGFDRAFDLIQQTEVPTWGPNGIGDLLSKDRNKPKIFDGDMSLVNGFSGTERVFTFVVPDKYAQAVEASLRNIVKFQMTDGKTTVKRMTDLILPKGEK